MYGIGLDAAKWRTTDDFYADLLSELKAPAWHGRNLDALWDTLTERAKFDDLTDYINGPASFSHRRAKRAVNDRAGESASSEN